MFESITIYNQNRMDASKSLDVGKLVECMLFYGQTNIKATAPILRQLFSYFNINQVIELIEEGLLQIEYSETWPGVLTKKIAGIEHHLVTHFESPNHPYKMELRKVCDDIFGKSKKDRRATKKIQHLIKVKNHEMIILDGARQLVLDQNYINTTAQCIIKSLIPCNIDTSNYEFYTEKSENGVIVNSNINFQALNQICTLNLTPAFILGHIVDSEGELYFSSNNLSEISTSELSARIISNRVNYLFEKSIKNSNEITGFQQLIFDDAKALREAVNEKKIDLDKLIKILKKSKQFKKWLAGADSDKDIIKNYYAEVTKRTILDDLPGKGVRWSIFTGGGIIADLIATGGIGTIAGLGLGLLDSFYLEKLVSGWKPNQFIEDVKGLVDKDN